MSIPPAEGPARDIAIVMNSHEPKSHQGIHRATDISDGGERICCDQTDCEYPANPQYCDSERTSKGVTPVNAATGIRNEREKADQKRIIGKMKSIKGVS